MKPLLTLLLTLSLAHAFAQFPVTIEHKFGSTTVEGKPERVIALG